MNLVFFPEIPIIKNCKKAEKQSMIKKYVCSYESSIVLLLSFLDTQEKTDSCMEYCKGGKHSF
jgi:hypothetical protein